MKRTFTVGGVTFLLVVVIGTGIAVNGSWSPLPIQEGGAPRAPVLSANVVYDDQAETARITATSPIRNDERSVNVTRLLVYVEQPDDKYRAPATIRADGTLHEDGRWVAAELPRIQAMPLEKGATVTVVSDGVDSDGDGTAGIEPGDTVVVIVEMGAEGKMTATIFERTVG